MTPSHLVAHVKVDVTYKVKCVALECWILKYNLFNLHFILIGVLLMLMFAIEYIYDLTFVILSFHISLIAGSKLSFEVSATCYGM
jgi:hypothetical protein